MNAEELNNLESGTDWWDNLSESQKQHINEGLKDAEEDRTISSAEFWEKLKNGDTNLNKTNQKSPLPGEI